MYEVRSNYQVLRKIKVYKKSTDILQCCFRLFYHLKFGTHLLRILLYVVIVASPYFILHLSIFRFAASSALCSRSLGQHVTQHAAPPQKKQRKGKDKAAGTRSIQSFTYPTLTDAAREKADRRFVLWSAVNFRPENMADDVGFKLFVGNLAPDYVARVMSRETFKDHLLSLYVEVKEEVLAEIKEHQESCLKMGYGGPFLGGQLDLTIISNEEYITFSVSFIPPGEVTIKRIGLATRAFPG